LEKAGKLGFEEMANGRFVVVDLHLYTPLPIIPSDRREFADKLGAYFPWESRMRSLRR
jgi:hypothetical protein